MYRLRKQLTTGCVALALVAQATAFAAGDHALRTASGQERSVPWPEEPISLYANDESVAQILSSVVGGRGISVRFDDPISETFSGKFRNLTAKEIYDQLAAIYELEWYYDGHQLHVAYAKTVNVQTIQLESITPEQLKQHLEGLGIAVDNYYWRTIPEHRLVAIGGPEDYLRRVQNLVAQLETGSRHMQTFFQWTDENGVTHISSELASTAFGAQSTRIPRTGASPMSTVSVSRPVSQFDPMSLGEPLADDESFATLVRKYAAEPETKP